MSAAHATGREVGSRELEELGLVFSSDANELGLWRSSTRIRCDCTSPSC